jgi:hypothetical protein
MENGPNDQKLDRICPIFAARRIKTAQGLAHLRGQGAQDVS